MCMLYHQSRSCARLEVHVCIFVRYIFTEGVSDWAEKLGACMPSHSSSSSFPPSASPVPPTSLSLSAQISHQPPPPLLPPASHLCRSSLPPPSSFPPFLTRMSHHQHTPFLPSPNPAQTPRAQLLSSCRRLLPPIPLSCSIRKRIHRHATPLPLSDLT